MSPTARALFVLTFMGILTLQTATGFLHDLIGGLRPRAVTAIDGLIDTTLVAPLGRTGAVIVLSGVSFLTAALAPAADDEIRSVIRTLARPAVTFRRDYPPSHFGRAGARADQPFHVRQILTARCYCFWMMPHAMRSAALPAGSVR